tara:strand:- start:225 stop:368 length:144 start_codon:yes stop_codon:yes gene_type:complete
MKSRNRNASRFTKDALSRAAKGQHENSKDRSKAYGKPRPGYKERKRK